jgi:hypothetical protein
MGQEARLGGPLGGTLGGALGLRPSGGSVVATPTIELLLVGGGGSGGTSDTGVAGGGAGGEVLEITLPSPALGAYPITIGLGAVAWFNYNTPTIATPTRFGTLIQALAGGSAQPSNGFGSERLIDGANTPGATTGFGLGSSPWPYPKALGGYIGGNAFDNGTEKGGGGGAGAGGPGGNASDTSRGLGGAPKFSSITGVALPYARGGDGGSNLGGGARPSEPGSGGKGGVFFDANKDGNAGILIARYLTGTQTWTGGAVTTVGPWTLHSFTANGTATRTS